MAIARARLREEQQLEFPAAQPSLRNNFAAPASAKYDRAQGYQQDHDVEEVRLP
jgi:hypothetical protein